MNPSKILLFVFPIVLAQTFCRCEDQQDLSYLLFVISEDFKTGIHGAFPDAKFHSDCSYCSKIVCQHQFERNVPLQEILVNCFKRESSRDMFVIYGFFLLIVALLVYPLISKRFMGPS